MRSRTRLTAAGCRPALPWPAPAAACVVALLAACLAAAGAAAQSQAGGDQDPLAFTRLESRPQSIEVTVVDLAAGQERTFAGKRLLQGSREVYLPSSAVAAALQATRSWQGQSGRLDLRIGSARFGLAAGTRLVEAPQGQALLPVPVLAYKGDLWLPMAALVRLLAAQGVGQPVWDPESARLQLGSPDYTLTGIAAQVQGRATVVRIACASAFSFSADSPRPGLLEVSVDGARVDPGAAAGLQPAGLLLGADCRQQQGRAVVSLQVDPLAGRARPYLAEDGHDILVVLEEQQTSALPDPVPRGHTSMNIELPPPAPVPALAVRTVVIDPGHGGQDLGAIGPSGVQEKDVNLAVAKELRQYLRRQSDLKVVMTRDDDSYLEPTARAELANVEGGDLYLSLHCNSWFDPQVQGLQTYHQGTPAGEQDSAPAAGAAADDGSFLPWEDVQERFLGESRALARVLHEEVVRSLGVVDRGVRRAGFRVLVGAHMPAVLVEMGFLSNPQEQDRLKDRDYQRRLARALGDALLAFKDRASGVEPDGRGRKDPDVRR